MDRRHGKRPFSSHESGEKEDQQQHHSHHHIFPFYSARSQHDTTAMVSALSHVIGSTNNNNSVSMVGNFPALPDHQSGASVETHAQSIQEQGTKRFFYEYVVTFKSSKKMLHFLMFPSMFLFLSAIVKENWKFFDEILCVDAPF